MRWKNYEYEITDGGAAVTRYLPEEAICVHVPERIGEYPVTEIGSEAFTEYGEGIERLSIPSSVKKIGDGAFRMCMSLTELNLCDGLEAIGEDAFSLTPLTKLYLPATVSEVGKLWELGGIRWEVDAKNPYFFTDGYGLYKKTDTGQELCVVSAEDEREEYRIADGTTSIGRGAFAGQESLRRIIFPPTLAVVGEEAFESCGNLEEALVCGGLTEIREGAFGHCVNLRDFFLPASLRVLGDDALTNTFGWSETANGIAHIEVSKDNPVFWADESALYEQRESGDIRLVKYFGDERHYSVRGAVSVIGKSAFRRSGLKTVRLPASVRAVEPEAFRECKSLEEIVFSPRLAGETRAQCEEDVMFSSRSAGETRARCGEDVMPSSRSAGETSAQSGGDVRLYVPRNPVYRKDEVMQLFGEDGFDAAGYDRLFATYLEIPEQGRMACCRLRYPVMLPEKMKETYRVFLREHLSEVLLGICGREDLGTLADLAAAGIFDGGNIDGAIDVFNKNRKAKLLSFLMDYKQEHLAEAGFDFSL